MLKLRIQQYLKNILEYRYIYLFCFFSILFDLIGVLFIEGKFIVEKPYILIMYLLFVSIFLYIVNKRIGRLLSIILLVIQGLINVVLKMVYDMQGRTVFSLSQLRFIKEGTGAATYYIIDYLLILNYFLLILLFSIMIFFNYFKRKKIRHSKKLSASNLIIRGLLILILICTIPFIFSNITVDNYFNYDNKTYSTPRKYQTFGVTGNFINELFSYKKVPDKMNEEKVYEFLFEKQNKAKGLSKGNNLIIIMVETLEWYSFIQDEVLYPNGLNNLTEEELKYLFPNLISFYEQSLKMSNYHSKETTIYSENLAILGNHPYKTVPTYDHTFANYEYSLPNMYKKRYPDAITNYYHNNNLTFYGRGSIMNNYGFDNVIGAEKLIDEYGDMLDYSEIKLKESISNGITDASMFKVAKEKMFPINETFLTYITTLTMHGSYEEKRESLSKYYERLDSIDKDIFPETKEGQIFKNYIASVLNFDDALGIMMTYLKDNDLLNNTTIVLFGDHQAYSNDLTYYVREETFFKPIVFSVPLMIYDTNLGNYTIDKFSTNIDIVPTIFDILGIDYYENFYYGNSIFDLEESVCYSYYYDGFLTDQILFNTLDKTIYIDEDVDKIYIAKIENKIKIMFEKVKYIDQWYYYYSKRE